VAFFFIFAKWLFHFLLSIGFTYDGECV